MAQEIADSTLLDTWGSGGNIVEPDISKIIEGWQLGEQPPHEYMNWLQNTFGSKLNHILKNGVASWNNTTQYLAGSSVQHNGNVWLCKTTNSNSEPADVNSNWKRIITIEALENLLVGYVATTGNQTIAGVKTFSSSPIVPTPTTGTQAVNKNYADLKVALESFIGTNQSLTTNGYQILPGGLIVQWGTKVGVETTIILPIAFPNANLVTGTFPYKASSDTFNIAPVTSKSVTGFTVIKYNQSGSLSGAGDVPWVAIGY